MAVVPLVALFGWLIAIFIVARAPRQRAAGTTLAGATGSETGSVSAATPANPAGQVAPKQTPDRRLAA